jgi:hypothetical protein
MTVIHGKIWPDHEFSPEVFGYHADRNSVHDFGTPFHTRKEVVKRTEHLKEDPNTFRLRIARYVLAEVEEIEVVGKRPEIKP